MIALLISSGGRASKRLTFPLPKQEKTVFLKIHKYCTICNMLCKYVQKYTITRILPHHRTQTGIEHGLSDLRYCYSISVDERLQKKESLSRPKKVCLRVTRCHYTLSILYTFLQDPTCKMSPFYENIS